MSSRCLDGDGRLDGGVGIVVVEAEVLEAEVVDVFDGRIDPHLRQRARLAGELEFGLLDVILIEMEVAEGVDEIARFVAADLGDHHR